MITETKIEIAKLFHELLSGMFHNINAPVYIADHIIRLASDLGITVQRGIIYREEGLVNLYI